MSDKVRQTLEIISDELAKPSPNSEKIGLLVRSVRWQKTFDREDKTKLVEMCVRLQDHPVEDSWIVERTIFEVLCVHAEPQHVPFLESAFRIKGKHGDDRRRFALRALSGVVAKYGDEKVLDILEDGLSHIKKDARGWMIGFLMESY